MQVATIILFVADVAALRRFYAEQLGLRVIEDEPGWARLDAGNTTIALHAIRGAAPASGAPREDSHVKIAFHADDVAAERERLVAAGVRMRDLVQFGDLVLADGFDPEGNVFQISNRAPVR